MRFGAARERALAASGWTSSAPLLLKQVHGTRIELAGECREERPRADGWIVARRGLAAAVYVADCLPVFLWDDEGAEAVGVVHAGWRGLAAGVLEAAVRGFESLGIAPRRLAASVGPHAGVCCYRVGPELKDRFREESFSGSRLDLGAEARFRLAGAGLDEASIAVSRDCTVCSPRDFFSFRREKARAWTLAFAALP
jgi:YfiH family protein